MMEKIREFRALNQEIVKCRKCRLWETRTHALPGEGNASSKLMFVAQAPGYNEDKEGRMFVGTSGKKLDELFAEVGFRRRDVFITNILRCMLPYYRRPRQDEIEASTPYLDREIELINPMIISTLGFFAAKYLFEKYGIGGELKFPDVCGRVFSVGDKRIFLLRHPAALLYDDSIHGEMLKNYRRLKGLRIRCKRGL